MSFTSAVFYEVLDNNRPAIIEGSALWENNKFGTFEEAKAYAINWLGSFTVDIKSLGKWYYTGYGDYIEIRVIQN